MDRSEIDAAVKKNDAVALDALLQRATGDERARRELLFSAASFGRVGAFERVVAGTRPTSVEEVWVTCAESAIDAAEKLTKLRALGQTCPPDALASYAESQVSTMGEVDHVTPTRLLLGVGADVNACIVEYSGAPIGWSTLMVAVLKEDLPWVQQLLEAGVDATVAATGARHPYADDYPVGKGVTPLKWAQRRQKAEPKSRLWASMVEALSGKKQPAKAKAAAGKKTEFAVRPFQQALEVFTKFTGATLRKREVDGWPLNEVPPGCYASTLQVFCPTDLEQESEDPPTPLFYVVEYDREEIKKWRKAQERALSDVKKFLRDFRYGALLGSVWNVSGKASTATIGKQPGFVAEVSLKGRHSKVSFLLGAWPVTEGFAVALLRAEDRDTLVEMVGLGAWPTKTEIVAVEFGE